MAGIGGLLGGLGGFFLGGPAGASLGGMLGGALDGNEEKNGGAGATSQTRDPWAAAQPYMRQNLQTNANLQKFYEQNPFNAQQKTGYQNQNNTIDQFNGQVAPGLLGFANQMMGSSYQRAHGGVAGSGAGYQGSVPQTGGGMVRDNPAGLLGPFSSPQHQNFGQIDFNAMNPSAAQNKINPANSAPTLETQDNFDEAAYLTANPDILKAGWDRGGWDHYMRHGKGEGRKFTGKGG